MKILLIKQEYNNLGYISAQFFATQFFFCGMGGEGRVFAGGALSQSCPMVFLKLAMGAVGSLPVLTEGGACACHCLLFHYYLHSPAAFTTLVSLCGHTETERDGGERLQGPNTIRKKLLL